MSEIKSYYGKRRNYIWLLEDKINGKKYGHDINKSSYKVLMKLRPQKYA